MLHQIRAIPAQDILLNLAGGRLWEFDHESESMWNFKVSEPFPGKSAQFSFTHDSGPVEDHKSMRGFSPFFVRNADHRDLLHGRMPQQKALDFDRGNVLTSADDDILEAITDFEIPVRMHHRAVARIKPAVANGFRRPGGIAIIAGHDGVAAHDDLAERFAVPWHFAPLRVENSQVAGGEQLDALPSLDGGARAGAQSSVFRPRLADGDKGRDFG